VGIPSGGLSPTPADNGMRKEKIEGDSGKEVDITKLRLWEKTEKLEEK